MTKFTTAELREILDGFYQTDMDIADQKKQLKEDMNDQADQLEVDHKAMAAAYNAYKKKMKAKDTDYLATCESVELIEIVENMFGPGMDDEE